MTTRSVLTLATAAALALGIAGHALADPDDKTDKRLDKIEKQVRELRSIIMQARDTGQPVQVRVTTDPDPTVQALATRMDDLEAASRTRNNQIDHLTHDLDQAKRDAATALDGLKDVEARLARIEARLKALDAAAAAVAPDAGTDAGPAVGSPPPGSGPAGSPPPARVGAAFGPPRGSVPAPGAADAAFDAAHQLLLEGQYGAASSAFQSFVETYGDTPKGPEARYWLGETLFIRGLYADAATAYIGAIRGWPQTGWAPDAVLKLSRSLIALGKPLDACRTLDEFDRRYTQASPNAKAKAADARAAAKCG